MRELARVVDPLPIARMETEEDDESSISVQGCPSETVSKQLLHEIMLLLDPE